MDWYVWRKYGLAWIKWSNSFDQKQNWPAEMPTLGAALLLKPPPMMKKLFSPLWIKQVTSHGLEPTWTNPNWYPTRPTAGLQKCLLVRESLGDISSFWMGVWKLGTYMRVCVCVCLNVSIEMTYEGLFIFLAQPWVEKLPTQRCAAWIPTFQLLMLRSDGRLRR